MFMSETSDIAQVITIPYRLNSADAPKFCMITSNKKQDWIFPKGTVDSGETPEQTALREAFEEAGLHGELDPDPLGNFTRQKWGLDVNTDVYLMQVTQVDETWGESHKRQRCWGSSEKTLRKIGKPYLVPYLQKAIERIERQCSVSLQASLHEK